MIIPTHSRNVYDAAIRAVGVKVIEVESPEALQLAIGPKTAMIYLFAGPRTDSGPMSTEAICAIAQPHDVPVFVDAAAEILTIPNVHLQRGATLVGYSGGKYIRGPQSAGLLLGRKDLVRAAWVHSAPHHGYARAMKVGREEIVGMLVAVESWVKRDHAAEWKQWVARCRLHRRPAVEGRGRAGVRAARAGRGAEQPQPARHDPLERAGAGHHRRRGGGPAVQDRAAHRAERRRTRPRRARSPRATPASRSSPR